MTPNGSLGPEGEDLFVVRRGEGPYVRDADGRRYIDGLSGLYCCQLGYSYAAEFAEAAGKQLRELCYSPLWTGSAHPTAIELAERLAGHRARRHRAHLLLQRRRRSRGDRVEDRPPLPRPATANPAAPRRSPGAAPTTA